MPANIESLYDKTKDTRPNEININPLTRGRRILLFLADLFMNLIIAVFLMNVAVVPIMKAAMHYNDYTEQIYERNEDIADILFANNLLFYENANYKTYLTTSEEYTAGKLIEYFTTGEDSEYDIFYNYYVTIRDDEETYYSVYDSSIYFVVSDGAVSLVPEYQELLSSFYRVGDTPSGEAETLYDNIVNDFFTVAFDDMIEDIALNDVWYNGMSYNMVDHEIEQLVAKVDTIVTISTYIAFFLSSLIYFLVIPLCTKHGKTIGMMIMKIERVGINNIYLLRKGEVAINSIYSIIANLVFIMFLPYPTVNFNYLFGLGNSQFLILSVIGLVVILVSLVILMVTQFNQTMFDKLSRTVFIDNDSLDEIYRARGYKV
ncbi:MAG: hypothetical protein LUC31_01215 [Coprobacillus sp.]|nr:hypothetical protein [Coprobacillus sp.]